MDVLHPTYINHAGHFSWHGNHEKAEERENPRRQSSTLQYRVVLCSTG